ncbi:FliM/FliN family flagellar motor switch protein [Mesorhizobium sp. ANAO-SY3R2]|uniref:FliM/FliN family flagellar motor switch protein n=1 Tax=Mesorhizobium sp. ANAO-SY3R2 TaxID=3166644 RepID=UPI00366EA7A2
MTKPWLPPQVGLDRTGLWNALVALSDQAIALEGASLAFTLTDAPRGDAWCLAFHPRSLDAPFLVHVRNFPFRERLGLELDVADFPSLPAGLHEAMYQGIALALAETVLPGQPDMLRLEKQNVLAAFKDFAGSNVQWFAVQVTGEDGLAIDLDLGADRKSLLRLVGDRLPLGSVAQRQLAQQIHVPAYITLGSISLTFGELALLESGAVVVMAKRSPSTMLVRIQDHLLDVAMVDDGWRCVDMQPLNDFPARVRHYAHDGGRGMSDDATEEELGHAPDPDATEVETQRVPGGTEGISVETLRLTIDFDIGRKSVPLADFSQWQMGTIVDLDMPVLSDGVAVTIRANGDVVGTGDLVRIDDRIAVRITRFLLD